MSTLDRAQGWTRPRLPAPRTLALVGLSTLLVSFLLVLRDIVDVSGDLSLFYLLAGGALVAATVFARLLRVVTAVALAGVLLTVGLFWYVLSLPYDPAIGGMIESNVDLLSGQSILEIERSTIWALSVTPTPVFVTWYLGLRGWYSSATLVASGMLAYFVLTGDAGLTVTLFGVVGAAATLGFGDLASRDDTGNAVEYVAVVLAIMVLSPAAVSVVPGDASGALAFAGDGGTADTIEANLLSPDKSFDVAGSISLSPAVRFTVNSPTARYWRVASYNRYTGDGWVQSGNTQSSSNADLRPPPGESRELTQTFRVESSTNAMPAAWRPVEVSGGVEDQTVVRRDGGLAYEGTFTAGDTYQVTSAVPAVSPESLDDSGDNDPRSIVDRYTQLPASTPDRVARRTANIVGNVDSRYQTARRIAYWLQTEREYSLDVEKPEGNIADSFLFEMERGYCTYYATTMVTMLRTQDIPARLAVGYTPGEQTDANEYTVRGLNSHAWVEVYFPETGWIQFDPTPAGPRQEAEQARIEESRSDSNNGTNGSTSTPTSTPNGPTPTPTATTPTPPGGATPTPLDTVTPTETRDEAGGGGTGLPELPSSDQLALGVIVLVGVAAGVRRSGLSERAYRWVWLRYQPRADPPTDIEHTHRRLLYLLEQRHRPRRAGETVRSYLDDIEAGPRARRLAELRERARYDNEATEAMAEQARDLLDSIRRQ